MELVEAKPEPADGRQTMEMRLVDKKGKTRLREVLSYSRKAADADQSVMVFLSPPDVKNVGFLSYDYADPKRDDDRWLYLPALKSVRKIAGSGGNDYFMGTDFTYDDLGGRDLDDFDYKLLGEDQVDGFACWIVETTPHDRDYGYSRLVQWIRQDALLSVRIDFYDRQGAPLKRLSVSKIDRVSGYWTIVEMEMSNSQNGHKTLLSLKDSRFDTGVNESLFRVSTLERGMIR